MEIQGKTVLVTGAAGGIGRALVQAFLAAGAKEVIAAGRRAPVTAERVTPLVLDLAEERSVAAAATACAARVDILVNNAGVNSNSGVLFPRDPATAAQEMDINYFGLLRMLRAFAPEMKRRGGGAIVNMLTMLSHMNLPLMGSYCASKAAALSLTQAARAELAAAGVKVIAILPSAVDTTMATKAPPPKLSPEEVAQATLQALRDEAEEVYPGPVATEFMATLRSNPKVLEKRLAQRLPH